MLYVVCAQCGCEEFIVEVNALLKSGSYEVVGLHCMDCDSFIHLTHKRDGKE